MSQVKQLKLKGICIDRCSCGAGHSQVACKASISCVLPNWLVKRFPLLVSYHINSHASNKSTIRSSHILLHTRGLLYISSEKLEASIICKPTKFNETTMSENFLIKGWLGRKALNEQRTQDTLKKIDSCLFSLASQLHSRPVVVVTNTSLGRIAAIWLQLANMEYWLKGANHLSIRITALEWNHLSG